MTSRPSISFGRTIALSGDGHTLAVGAPGEASVATGIWGNQSSNNASGSGAAYVFLKSGSAWTQEAYVKASNTDAQDGFGSALALSADGTTLAVAAPGESSNATGASGAQSDTNQADDTVPFSGAVYVFGRRGSTWSQQAYVKASNTGANDFFGSSVALNGDGSTLAVGAQYEDSNATGLGGDEASNSATSSGAVYVMAR